MRRISRRLERKKLNEADGQHIFRKGKDSSA